MDFESIHRECKGLAVLIQYAILIRVTVSRLCQQT